MPSNLFKITVTSGDGNDPKKNDENTANSQQKSENLNSKSADKDTRQVQMVSQSQTAEVQNDNNGKKKKKRKKPKKHNTKKIVFTVIMPIILVISVALWVFTSMFSRNFGGAGTDVSNYSSTPETTKYSSFDTTDMFTERDLDPSYTDTAYTITLADGASESSSSSVTVDDDTITITDEGIYEVSGSLSDGQIIVDAEDTDKVQLVLNSVSIESSSSAAIYVASANKVFITAEDGTESTLVNSGEYVAIDDNNIDAVVFSKDDLTINGTGTINISSDYGHGVVSKDDLVVASVTLNIDVSNHCLSANNSVRVASGTYNFTTEVDGINVDSEDDDTTGYVYIEDGELNIAVEDDGIHANNLIYIVGGTINITESYEGIEAEEIYISDGDISVYATDDGLNASSDGNATEDSTFDFSTDDSTDDDDDTTGTSATDDVNIVNVMNSAGDNSDSSDFSGNGEDFSGDVPDMDGAEDFSGEMPSTDGTEDFSTDGTFDMSNVAGGMTLETDDSCIITIVGGTINITAESDGIDSNGYLIVYGGEIYVSTPTNNGNSALDYGINAVIEGGTIIAAGDSGMAQNFGSESTQCSILATVDSSSDEITVEDSDGNVILSFTPSQSYNSVLVSCADIEVGETYTIAGTEVEVTDTITGEGFSMTGMGGTMGGTTGGDFSADDAEGFAGGAGGGNMGGGNMPGGSAPSNSGTSSSNAGAVVGSSDGSNAST